MVISYKSALQQLQVLCLHLVELIQCVHLRTFEIDILLAQTQAVAVCHALSSSVKRHCYSCCDLVAFDVTLQSEE